MRFNCFSVSSVVVLPTWDAKGSMIGGLNREKVEQSLVQSLLVQLSIPAKGKFYFPFSEKVHPTNKRASCNEDY